MPLRTRFLAQSRCSGNAGSQMSEVREGVMEITTYNSIMDRTTLAMWLSQDPWKAPTLSVPQTLDCSVVSLFPSEADEGVLCGRESRAGGGSAPRGICRPRGADNLPSSSGPWEGFQNGALMLCPPGC